MKKISVIILLVFGCACTIHPPSDNGDDLGAPTTTAAVRASVIDAQSGGDFDKSFRVGDWGRVLLINTSITGSMVSETHEQKVTQITPDQFIFTDHYVEANMDTTYAYQRKKPDDPPSAFFHKLTEPFRRLASLVKERFLSHIFIHPSRAIALSQADTGAILNSNSTVVHAMDDQFSQLIEDSHYYGLKVSKDRILTNNCSQLSDCKVNATTIEFNQMKDRDDGSQIRIHWKYIITTETPGLFWLLERCLSFVASDPNSNSKVPFSRCVQVADFKFGAAN